MENRRRHVVSGRCLPGRDAFKAIDNYRNCVKDEIEFLREENQDMRIRLSKFDEIESRVETLLIRDQHNVRQLELLRESLHVKAGEVEDLRHCIELEKHNSAQKEAALKGEMQSLISEVGWINRDRQEADVLVEKRFEQIRAISAREVESSRSDAAHAQQQAQMHIARLEDTIRTLTVEIQQKDRENGAVRLRLMDQLQQLASRNDQFNRDNTRLNQQNGNMRVDLTGLINELHILKQAHEALTVDKLRSEQERAQLIIDLKEVERQLGCSMRDTRSMEEQLIQRDSELNRLANISKELSMNCEDLEDQLRKKNRLLDEYHSQLRKQQDHHRQQATEMTARLMHLQSQVNNGRADIMSLTERIQVLQHQTDAKTVEIRDLLYGIQKLEEKLLGFEAKCRILENDNNMTAQKLSYLGQERQSGCFELRSMQEKVLLKETHIQELTELLEAERTAKLIKDKQLQEVRRTLNSPNQIGRRYEDQMLRMVRLFESEKAAMEEKFTEQKIRLRQLYDYELKDTQDLFERKMRILQQQIHS